MKWVLAATLISGASVFTSCVDSSTDNPVVPEPAVPDHFINEALMDKTVKPGDDFYNRATVEFPFGNGMRMPIQVKIHDDGSVWVEMMGNPFAKLERK